MTVETLSRAAHVNGVQISSENEVLTRETLQQRAYTELLRQEAQAAGLLSAADVAKLHFNLAVQAITARQVRTQHSFAANAD